MNKLYISLVCISASLSLSASNWENKPLLQASSEQVSASVSEISHTQFIKNKLGAFAKKPVVRCATAATVCLSLGSYMLWKNMYSVNAEQNSVVAKEVAVDVTDENSSTDNSSLNVDQEKKENNGDVIDKQNRRYSPSYILQQVRQYSLSDVIQRGIATGAVLVMGTAVVVVAINR